MMQEWSQVGGTAVRLEGHEEKWAPFICVGVCVGSFGLFLQFSQYCLRDRIHGSSLPGFIHVWLVFINHQSDCATVLPWAFSHGFPSLQESI